MALITSAATGNFSAGATWTGGVVPTVGDEARASNGHTITIDVDTTCDEVSNAGTGIFTLADGVTLTANVTNKSTTTSRNCLQFTAASPAIGYIVGNVTGGTVSGAVGAAIASTGTLDIEGNVTAGSGANAHGVTASSSCALIIEGNVTGAGGSGVSSSSAGPLTITGNIVGGSSASGVIVTAINTTTITGDITGGTGSGGRGLFVNGALTANVTGDVTGGSAATTEGLLINAAGATVNVTGIVTGGSNTGGLGLSNSVAGTVTVVGSVVASAVAIGAQNTSTGTMTVTRAVGNSWGIGAAGGTNSVVGLVSSNVASDTRAEELEYGTNGQAPTSGAVRIVSATNNKTLVTLTTSAVKTLADPSDGTGQANEADVRSGVSYALGNKTGTCAVPAASSVAFGVPVDATTGTAALTPAAVWDALTSGMTTSGSIGARLKNAATLDSTGQQLADALSPVP